MSYRIIGTGSALPRKVVTNDDLAEFLDTSDEWIHTRTGIRRRHVCTTETLDDLASLAAERALEMSGLTVGDIDLIVGSTSSADHMVPAMASIVQGALGADCMSFDVYVGCSGFVAALDVADGYFARGRARHALIVAAEKVTRLVDWTDRSTCVLFGDGAGAVVVEHVEGEDLPFRATNQPSMALVMPGIPSRSPYDEHRDAGVSSLVMDGRAVFRFAVKSVTEDIQRLCEAAGVAIDDVDHFVLHQANDRIIASVVQHLGLDDAKVAHNIAETGNISSACIPLALDLANRRGDLRRGDLIALVGYGAGLAVNSCLFRWDMGSVA